MKQYLPILLFLFAYACQNQATKEIPYTIIKGKIIRIPPPENRMTVNGIDWAEIEKRRTQIGVISNAMRSGIEVANHNGNLDVEGNFHFIIKINEPTEIRIKYYYQSIPIYVEPGDEVAVILDLTREENPITVTGDHKEISEKFIAFDQLFRDSFNTELNATLPYAIPNEFKTQRAKITKRIRQTTQNFVKTDGSNEIVANWVQNHAEYRIAMDYLKYAFRTYGFSEYSPNLRAGIGEYYFDFWEEFPVDNPLAIGNLNYQNYLQFYRKYTMAKLRQTTPYQDCVNLPTCNEFEMEVAELSNILTGRTKDLTLSQQADYHLIRNNNAFMKDGFSTYLNEITDSIIHKDLLARKDFLYEERAFEFPKNASLIQSDADGKEILNNIIQRNPNKATLLYFWNTQREIAWYYESEAQLHDVWKSLDSLDIKLVLMTHHSTPNLWKEKIEEYGLIGDLWHLSDKQFSFFEDFFKNNRQPHFNYDKIYDRENFLLLIDRNQNLNTINDISFRESGFTWLNMLPSEFKYLKEKQRKTQITTE